MKEVVHKKRGDLSGLEVIIVNYEYRVKEVREIRM